MKAGQKKHMRKCLKGCKATIVRNTLDFRDIATVLAQVCSGPEGLSARAGDVWGGSKGVEV